MTADESTPTPDQAQPVPTGQDVPTPAQPRAAQPRAVQQRRSFVIADLGHPFRWGFVAAAGALTAYVLGGMLGSLSTVLVYVGLAVFLTLALDPAVRWLERHKISRALAIALVLVALALLLTGLVAIAVPTAVEQVAVFAQSVPGWISQIQESDWLTSILATTGTESAVDQAIDQLRAYLSDPQNLLAISGGVLSIGSGVASAVTGVGMTFVLTVYFLATVGSMRTGLGRLLPAYARQRVSGLVDQVAESVGGYVAGMLFMGVCNAVFSFVLLSLLGVPFAVLLAVLALFVSMIPLIGPMLFLIVAGVVSLFTSPLTGLIFVLVYFAYTQFEAYVLTPRVMNKQVSVPGSLVIIGALVGATLLGLLGVLVSVPVAATLLLIIQQFVIPKQDAKLVPPPDSPYA